jgi:hypothetical protein
MAGKPKARDPKAKHPKRKISQKEQSERFIDTARRIGVDESGERFERAFGKIVPPKVTKSSQSG